MNPNLYLVRMAQVHPTFRKPELEALALMAGVEVEFVQYSEYVCLINSLDSLGFKWLRKQSCKR